MMMIGEISYYEFVESGQTSIIKHIFIICFVFLVSILVANLLIGLAVSDIPELIQQGHTKRLEKEAYYIVSYERLMKLTFKYHIFPRFVQLYLDRKFSIPEKIVINLNAKNNCLDIPQSIIKKAYEIIESRKNHDQNSSIENKLNCMYNNLEEKYNHITEQLNVIIQILGAERIKSIKNYGRNYQELNA